VPKVEIQTPEGWSVYGEYRSEDEAARVAETLTKRGFSARVSGLESWDYAVEARKPGGMWSVQRWFKKKESAIAKAKELADLHPEFEWRVTKYPELEVVWGVG